MNPVQHGKNNSGRPQNTRNSASDTTGRKKKKTVYNQADCSHHPENCFTF
jgi:hypothetical protein